MYYTLPFLVMFGLDYTLWPFNAADVCPPYEITRKGGIFDSEDMPLSIFEDVKAIFEKLRNAKVIIAVGTTGINAYMAGNLLEVFGLEGYVSYTEFMEHNYPDMFRNLHNRTQIDYSYMLFFDDKEESIKNVTELGVYCKHVPQGINMKLFDEAMQHFKESKEKLNANLANKN